MSVTLITWLRYLSSVSTALDFRDGEVNIRCRSYVTHLCHVRPSLHLLVFFCSLIYQYVVIWYSFCYDSVYDVKSAVFIPLLI
jgi:hypothetical protein